MPHQTVDLSPVLGPEFLQGCMEDVSYAGVSRWTLRAELKAESAEEGPLKALAQQLADEHLAKMDEGTVFLYLSGMWIDHLAYAVGEYRRGKPLEWHLNTFATMTRQISVERTADRLLEARAVKPDPVCRSLAGTPRVWCYLDRPHPDHEALTFVQAVGDLKTTFRGLLLAVREALLTQLRRGAWRQG